MTRLLIIRFSAALALFLALSASCDACGEPQPDGGPATDEEDLATPLADDEVRCGRVTSERELIGGIAAYGRVGRTFRCYNSKIRFLVQDNVDPIGASAEGGTLIDIDLVRDDEDTPGKDAFREFIFATGVQEIEVESIEVVNDGSGGDEAVLRLEGHPAPLSVAPQVAVLTQDLPALVRHEFVIKPNSAVMEIRTTLFNEGDDQIYNIFFADAVAFGGANLAHNPVTGFVEAPPFSTTPWIAFGASENASYGYWCSDRDVTLPFDSYGVKVALCADDLILVRELTYSRYFAVGDGTLDSVARLAMDTREIPYGEITGTVTREGQPAPVGTQVFALDSDDVGSAAVMSQTVVDEDGGYALALPPGQYYILATFEVGIRSDIQALAVDADTSASVDVALPAPGRLTVRTNFENADGEPLSVRPAKISLVAESGGALPLESLGESPQGNVWGAFPSVDGRVEVDVPAGDYRVYVTRGFTYTRSEQTVSVASGGASELEATIRRVIDTEGLVATEFHQHSLGSLDGSVAPQVRVLENAAEGIRFAATTDHDNIVDFAPLVEEFGLAPWLQVVPGSEVSYQSIGHFNVYPWQIDPEAPLRDLGVKMWWQKTAPEMFAFLRERAQDPIIQVNHPRGGTAAFFSAMRLNPVDATRHDRDPTTLATLPPNIYEEWSSNFEALEVDGDIGALETYRPEADADVSERADRDPGSIPAFADYLALLGAGLKVAAMGNSDSHHFNQGIGYPRSYVRVGQPNDSDASALSQDTVRTAIRAQAVSIANGCLITLVDANQAAPMGADEAVATADGLRVKVQAPPHAQVDTVELFINGRVQPLTFEDGTLTVVDDGALRAPVAASEAVTRVDAPIAGIPSGDNDLVIIATAHGAGGLAPTGGSRVYCISAPVYVDRGASGFVGWLEDTQTIR